METLNALRVRAFPHHDSLPGFPLAESLYSDDDGSENYYPPLNDRDHGNRRHIRPSVTILQPPVIVIQASSYGGDYETEPSTSSSVSSISSDTHSTPSVRVDTDTVAHRCPICLERKERLATLFCGHVFCTRCVRPGGALITYTKLFP